MPVGFEPMMGKRLAPMTDAVLRRLKLSQLGEEPAKLGGMSDLGNMTRGLDLLSSRVGDRFAQMDQIISEEALLRTQQRAQEASEALLRRSAAARPRGGGFVPGQVSGPAGRPSGNIVPVVGQKGHFLDAAAAASLQGIPVRLTDSFRTNAQQADLYRRKPGLAAKPGRSLHEKGLAIDVANWREVRHLLLAAGWKQFNAKKEPWHFSYGVTG